ncbi:transposase [Streptosporangium sp. NPDC001681]|uniref:transposase n=1 Tax=Streptosporangium sp. NPDC001681 TaxID=3154395 RepID=UPI0033309B6D
MAPQAPHATDLLVQQISPFTAAVERLDEVPGIGLTTAHAIIIEIGLDMSRFPTAAHLTSWAKFAPGVKESAGQRKGKDMLLRVYAKCMEGQRHRANGKIADALSG